MNARKTYEISSSPKRVMGGEERLSFPEKTSVVRYHSVCNDNGLAFRVEIIDVFLAGTRRFIYLFSLPKTVFFLSY